ncbi:MAG TPA: preprotein translocase subunit SecG [Verrucomicrobiae bacterium]|nr:preprotein translocase subunit SecG [Verrucomicrobiae bacterium]
MHFIAGILTVLLLANCILLTLLVLVQLPKKDAGAGIAFGGGTADALFGAGSGNALTKITKWSAGIFFGMSLILGFVEQSANRTSTSSFENAVNQTQSKMQQSQVPAGVPPGTAPAATSTTPVTTNSEPSLPAVPAGGTPAATQTN